ncbi:Ubiquitin interaction domain-containing protein [Pleurostoma richardsiae]|uniref:Ubiquitin interaction domain-containing protein n=1 Tax=Pleurostoma richardsiae TaxID=41990 RepID=A0AA38VTJ3_9PEZI|nr:Ubiquitin interaction domain-containing protein [Pleurostoma richardsiae]
MASNRALEINGEEDDNAALERAITLSLEQNLTRNGPSSVPAVEPELDDTDEHNETVHSTKDATRNASSVLGLDRKKMEEERLARRGKRKAAETASAGDEPQSQRPKLNSVSPSDRNICEQSKATRVPQGKQPQESMPVNPRSGEASSPSRLAFPKGVVKKTWALGYPRKDDIKIEEILQKDDLELAILSSFQWDEDWLMSKLNLRQTKVILIAYATDETQQAEMRSNVPRDIIRFCFPSMEGASYMHSKLQLLKYPDHLRIAVPTGNLVPYDWGESGVMENMVFLIDLPRIDDPEERLNNELPLFGKELSHFLSAQGMDHKLVESLRNYDFSETSRYGFVHTIGGSHVSDRQHTGYYGLARAVNALGLATDKPVDVDYVSASVGSITREFVASLYKACQGDLSTTESKKITANPKNKHVVPSTNLSTILKERFRVYFPSVETVTQSRGGKTGAGTICLQARWWSSPTFPREILRDCKNVRPGLLLHSKLIFVRRIPTDANQCVGWAYLGSANLSESAWGRLVKDRATGQPKLNCRNWECGVLVPVSMHSFDQNAIYGSDGKASMSETFHGCIPVPMETPGSQHDFNGPKRPWFYREA